MRKKTHKEHRKLSTDSLLKAGKKRDIELAENELNQVTGGDKSQVVWTGISKTGGGDPYLVGKDGSPIVLPIGTKA
jgi:bacteriocin-like protein